MSICVCCDKSVNTENQAYFSGEPLLSGETLMMRDFTGCLLLNIGKPVSSWFG